MHCLRRASGYLPACRDINGPGCRLICGRSKHGFDSGRILLNELAMRERDRNAFGLEAVPQRHSDKSARHAEVSARHYTPFFDLISG